MRWLKGNVTFRRFRVAGPKPRVFGDGHLGRLALNKGNRQSPAQADGRRYGWAAGSHVFDTDFAPAKNVVNDALLFDLWCERSPLPPERLKAYYETELKALAANNPSGFPSAKQKREARGLARDQLEQEAKDGRYKKWTLTPCLWDSVRNDFLFGSASTASDDRLDSLFKATWNANLVDTERFADELTPLTAATIAEDYSAQAKHERPSAFVKGVTPDEVSWCVASDDVAFLGNEFLLWLWFYGERESDTMKTPDGSEVTFMFSGGVRLDCPRGQTGDDTINHDSAVRTPEARASLKTGKLPRKAALTVVRHDDQYSFKLQAETLAVSSARLPKPDAEVTGRSADEHRIGCVRDLAEIVEQLYLAFLGRRLSSYWSAELAAMQGWIKGGKVAA